MLAALLTGTFCMAENLLQNGDMKTQKGWAIWGGSPSDAKIRAKILSYVNEGPNGARVLKFKETFSKYNTYLIQWVPVSDVTAESQFKLTFSLKAEAGKTFPIRLQMMMPDPEKPGKTKYAGYFERKIVGTGDWKRYEMAFSKLKPGLSKIGLAFYPQTDILDKSQTGSFLLTDVSLELVR